MSVVTGVPGGSRHGPQFNHADLQRTLNELIERNGLIPSVILAAQDHHFLFEDDSPSDDSTIIEPLPVGHGLVLLAITAAGIPCGSYREVPVHIIKMGMMTIGVKLASVGLYISYPSLTIKNSFFTSAVLGLPVLLYKQSYKEYFQIVPLMTAMKLACNEIMFFKWSENLILTSVLYLNWNTPRMLFVTSFMISLTKFLSNNGNVKEDMMTQGELAIILSLIPVVLTKNIVFENPQLFMIYAAFIISKIALFKKVANEDTNEEVPDGGSPCSKNLYVAATLFSSIFFFGQVPSYRYIGLTGSALFLVKKCSLFFDQVNVTHCSMLALTLLCFHEKLLGLASPHISNGPAVDYYAERLAGCLIKTCKNFSNVVGRFFKKSKL